MMIMTKSMTTATTASTTILVCRLHRSQKSTDTNNIDLSTGEMQSRPYWNWNSELRHGRNADKVFPGVLTILLARYLNNSYNDNENNTNNVSIYYRKTG